MRLVQYETQRPDIKSNVLYQMLNEVSVFLINNQAISYHKEVKF